MRRWFETDKTYNNEYLLLTSPYIGRYWSIKRMDKEFRKLQEKWYKKLKKSGFNDIEWVDNETGKGQNTSFLEKSGRQSKLRSNISHSIINLTQDFYRACENYLQHTKKPTNLQRNIIFSYFSGTEVDEIYKNYAHLRPKVSKRFIRDTIYQYINLDLHLLSPREQRVFEWFTEGKSYRWISARLKHKPKSIFWISHLIVRILQDCKLFNETHEEGLLCYVDTMANYGID